MEVKMMAGYIRSKGQVLSRSQIRKSLQRINPMQPITKGDDEFCAKKLS